jgi:CRISPR-associated protein Csm3
MDENSEFEGDTGEHGLKALIEPKHNKSISRNDFGIYAHASDKTPNGCIVCEFEVETITDFRMPGVEEETVTVVGVPVIPGSTIKGFLKKHFVKKWGAGTIDDIFGPAKPKFGHRSRILVSDAFNNVPTTDRIPEGEKLECWIVFDNMDKNDITEIINTLSSVQRITGKTAAEQISEGNVVQFSLKKAWKFCIDDFEYDVTSQLEAA